MLVLTELDRCAVPFLSSVKWSQTKTRDAINCTDVKLIQKGGGGGGRKMKWSSRPVLLVTYSFEKEKERTLIKTTTALFAVSTWSVNMEWV